MFGRLSYVTARDLLFLLKKYDKPKKVLYMRQKFSSNSVWLATQ
jgi:hypothetical protein